LRQTIPYPDQPHCSAISADGRFLAIGGRFGNWTLWSLQDWRPIFARTNSNSILGITLSPGGEQLALLAGDTLEIWNIVDHRQVSAIPRNYNAVDVHAHEVAFSPDGQTIAYTQGDSRIILHRVLSGAET